MLVGNRAAPEGLPRPGMVNRDPPKQVVGSTLKSSAQTRQQYRTGNAE